MTFIAEPYKVKLELMSNEVENLIEELMRVPKNIYDFLNYDLLIVKLKLSLDASSIKKGCGKYITGDFGGQPCGTMT